MTLPLHITDYMETVMPMKAHLKYLALGTLVISLFTFPKSGISATSASQGKKASPIYLNPKYPIDKRVDDLLGRMTLKEKIELIGGNEFSTKPIPRLGIPKLRMSDGALGVRRWGPSTDYPCGTDLAATWDTTLISKVGKAIGQELKAKGGDILLGPNVNIARIPLGGRTFEAYGEDPYLTSRMAVSYIEGLQSEGVAATVKHFDANNQEYERMFVNEKVSKLALNEIYMPAFKAAVQEAHVLCVMAAYNKVNGQYCSENQYLLEKKLLHDWGFKGLIMSDWGAVHSSIPVANGGLDLEMPTGQYLNDSTLIPAIKSGKVKISSINDKVRRILWVMFKLGLFEHPHTSNPALVNTPEDRRIAYQAAVEGIVLLKNEGHVLPLDVHKLKSIAVIGPNAAIARPSGGGSAAITPIYTVSPLEALRSKLGHSVKINFAQGVELGGDAFPMASSYLYLPDKNQHGLDAEYFGNDTLGGRPVYTNVDSAINFNWAGNSPAPGVQGNFFSVRWIGRFKAPASGNYVFNLTSDDGSRMFINGKLVIDNWGPHSPVERSYEMHVEKGKFYNLRVEYFQGTGGSMVVMGMREPTTEMIAHAAAVAKRSDVALLFVGTSSYYEREGQDRDSLGLPADQDALIKAVANANKKTIVVMISGAPVQMNHWIGDVPGLMQAWFGGDESGNAIADVLLGKHDPSGRLPITFPVKWSDCSAYSSYKRQDSVSVYSDGVFVGYRWFDKHNIKPLFPFGYGLSYTKFIYSDLKIRPAAGDYIVTFKVRNAGRVVGVAVPQLYVHDPNPAPNVPVKALKKFDRVSLKPGQTSTVTFSVDANTFSHYNPREGKWITNPGRYDILIGSSSRDIRLDGKLTIEKKQD